MVLRLLALVLICVVMVSCGGLQQAGDEPRLPEGPAREDDPGKCLLTLSNADPNGPRLLQCGADKVPADDHPYAADLAVGDPLVLGVIERGAGSWRDVDDYDRIPGLYFQYWLVGDVPAEASGQWHSHAELPPGNVVVRLRVPPGFDVARARLSLAFPRVSGDAPADVSYVTAWTPDDATNYSNYQQSLNDYYVSGPFSSNGETATLQRLGYTYTLVDAG
ncbi:MAG: hypothetical protein F4185_03510 [Chloroflexi bacterium]|nr:hypothetical protein [Chloroflexota bacterium]MYF65010.1 hypothetical protein [Chloroflexota bacterium]MYK35586.1 hypothetical protein [Chloroflexota bacterium]